MLIENGATKTARSGHIWYDSLASQHSTAACFLDRHGHAWMHALLSMKSEDVWTNGKSIYIELFFLPYYFWERESQSFAGERLLLVLAGWVQARRQSLIWSHNGTSATKRA
jgi:hypothetical protein